jgi:hypothetical protein
MATLRKSRRSAAPDVVARLRSTAVADWLTRAERAEVVRMVREAVRTGDYDEVGRLAPSARWRMLGDHRKALAGVERSIVRFRRQRAGAELASVTGEDPAEVALRFGLGFVPSHVEPAGEAAWLAAGPLA